MEKTYIQFTKYTPPADLGGRIALYLREREQRREKYRAILFGIVAFAAFLGIVPAVSNVLTSATHSGFAGYASLIFSDWSTVALMWKTFALSLAETAPLFATAVSLATLVVFLWSAAEAIRYSRAARMSLALK